MNLVLFLYRNNDKVAIIFIIYLLNHFFFYLNVYIVKRMLLSEINGNVNENQKLKLV